MSTRGIIVVTSKEKTVRIYKHSDSYPTDNLALIANALASMKAGTRTSSRKKLEKKLCLNPVDQISQLILKEAELDPSNLEETFQGYLKPAMLGGQCDLEWVYVVDTDAKTVNVYGGGYTGSPPQTAFKRGIVDPLTYADKLIESYQEKEREEIREAMEDVKATGFALNPATKKGVKPRSKKSKPEATA